MQSVNLQAIAAKSEADIKSVRKYWLHPERRETMKPSVCRRIAKAAKQLGYQEPLPADGGGA